MMARGNVVFNMNVLLILNTANNTINDSVIGLKVRNQPNIRNRLKGLGNP